MVKHGAMPKYNFLLCDRRSRVRYPKSFYLTDIEAARQVARRIAWASDRSALQNNIRTGDRQSGLAVEIVDDTCRTVLTISSREAEEAKA